MAIGAPAARKGPGYEETGFVIRKRSKHVDYLCAIAQGGVLHQPWRIGSVKWNQPLLLVVS